MIVCSVLAILLQSCHSYDYYFPLCDIKATIHNFQPKELKSLIKNDRTPQLQFHRSITSIVHGWKNDKAIVDVSLNQWQTEAKEWLEGYSHHHFDDNLCSMYAGIANRSGWCWQFPYERSGDALDFYYINRERIDIKKDDKVKQITTRMDQCYVLCNNRLAAFIQWTPMKPVAYPEKIIFSIFINPVLNKAEHYFVQKMALEKMKNFVQSQENYIPSAIYQLNFSPEIISLNTPVLDIVFNTYYKEKLSRGMQTKHEIEEISFSLKDLLKRPTGQYGKYQKKKIEENPILFLRQFLTVQNQFNIETCGHYYWHYNLQNIIYKMEHPDESSFYDVYGIFDESSVPVGGTVIKRKNHLIDHDIIACTISKKEQPSHVFDNFVNSPDALVNKYILWKLYTHILQNHPTLTPDLKKDNALWQLPTRNIATRDFFGLIYRKTNSSDSL